MTPQTAITFAPLSTWIAAARKPGIWWSSTCVPTSPGRSACSGGTPSPEPRRSPCGDCERHRVPPVSEPPTARAPTDLRHPPPAATHSQAAPQPTIRRNLATGYSQRRPPIHGSNLRSSPWIPLGAASRSARDAARPLPPAHPAPRREPLAATTAHLGQRVPAPRSHQPDDTLAPHPHPSADSRPPIRTRHRIRRQTPPATSTAPCCHVSWTTAAKTDTCPASTSPHTVTRSRQHDPAAAPS